LSLEVILSEEVQYREKAGIKRSKPKGNFDYKDR
jgi:hypothetical protein